MKTLCNGRARLVLAAALLLLTLGSWSAAFGQLTPSDDAYVNSALPTTNYGAATTLNLQSAAETTFIRFDLSAVPSGYTGSSIAKATLKLYVNSVTTAGSLNVDYVTGTWTEKTITYSLQPALGTTIASSVPLTTASKGKYVEIDVTAAMVEWLNNAQPNDGIALVANSPLVATFDSKENTGASHPAEIDIVYAGIAGVNTANGSGLIGGGNSGTLNLALTNTCATNQVLHWNGSAWACATAGTGTITGVTAGADLTGGGTSGNVTLNLDATKIPLLNKANTFFGTQTVNGDLNASGTLYGGNVYVANAGVNATSIAGVASATTGEGWGVYGETDSNTKSAIGVYGWARATSGPGVGVYGASASSSGVGTMGQVGPVSGEKSGYLSGGFGAGVWGDAGFASLSVAGVVGTADVAPAGQFQNNSASQATVVAVNDNASGFPFYAFHADKYCDIDAAGNLNCSGAKHAVVPIDGGQRKVALSAIESPKNWFEDFGSGQLSAGVAAVALEPDFAQTVNTGVEYHVFLTPRGECEGLYVASTTASGFEVRELHHGSSSVTFDYRIVALRKNFENIRLEDHTKDPDPAKFMEARKKNAPAKVDMRPLMTQQKPAPNTHPIAQKAIR
jgi:hypothetical protein